MTKEQFDYICQKAVEYVKELCPVDTGNLKYNAIQFYYIDETTFRIEVNEDIAPYMPYTNEPWTASRWNGAKNPNEGWWELATRFVAEMIVDELYGQGAQLKVSGE